MKQKVTKPTTKTGRAASQQNAIELQCSLFSLQLCYVHNGRLITFFSATYRYRVTWVITIVIGSKFS